MRPIKKTLPINLIIDESQAIVVGGGRVGLRKSHLLCEQGMRVKLICPDALEEFSQLPVQWIQKPFAPEDLDGGDIVFACTDDKYVNRAVLAAARERHILCCCADGNWAESDFTTPAVIRTDDLLFTVSTHGRSCREAKEVKHLLERMISHTSAGELFIHGISHEHATLQERATYATNSIEKRKDLARRLSFLNGLYEWCFLDTCNRTEFIAWATPELVASGLLNHALHLPSTTAHTYAGADALKFLSFILAGLKSQVLGEFHITGQVRDAFNEARDEGWATGPLQTQYALALQRAQTLRTATAPLIPQIEIEDLALQGAKAPVLILGTGALGQALIAKCKAKGLSYTVLYHSRPLAGEPCRPLTEFAQAAQASQWIVSALSTPSPIADVSALTIPCYDLSVPRSITGDNVIDLDQIKGNYLRAHACYEAVQARAEDCYGAL